jgi:hypothetical protein
MAKNLNTKISEANDLGACHDLGPSNGHDRAISMAGTRSDVTEWCGNARDELLIDRAAADGEARVEDVPEEAK